MTARQARETNPEGATQSVGPPPQPGAFRRILQPLINRWPVTITAAPVFQAEHIDHGLGFALGGLPANAPPPAIAWARTKRVR